MDDYERRITRPRPDLPPVTIQIQHLHPAWDRHWNCIYNEAVYLKLGTQLHKGIVEGKWDRACPGLRGNHHLSSPQFLADMIKSRFFNTRLQWKQQQPVDARITDPTERENAEREKCEENRRKYDLKNKRSRRDGRAVSVSISVILRYVNTNKIISRMP
jgi:hypothetical protein